MIEINNLSFEIDNKFILNDINLKIEQGKIFGIIGPNGVGKSTLIKCLTGIYKPTKGSIKFDGIEVYDKPEVKAKIGYVSDENILQLNFKVRDIMKFYKYSYEKFDEEKFNKLNEVFKVPVNKFIFQLSKGMKMRVSILLALSINAKYLILDESTSGLDAMLKNELLKIYLNEVYENKTTIIISSHHLNELEKICDSVAILKDGKVVYKESLENIKKNTKKIQVAFKNDISEEKIKSKGLNILSKIGRVFTIIIDENMKSFSNKIKELEPLFIEEIDISLEEIFVYKVNKEEV